MSYNLELLVRDTLGEDAWNVYNTQSILNEAFASDYNLAYAYGPTTEPRKVHERVAAEGAKQLNLDLQDYLDTWDEVVELIDAFQELPDEFKDSKYLESN